MGLGAFLAGAGHAQAQTQNQAVEADLSVSTSGGFTRLVFRMEQEVESEVRLSNGILVIRFKQPMNVNVDRIAMAASSAISAARRDPDGTGIRIALARRVTINSMTAGERLYVDILPETWTGLPPGLPQDVVDDLAKRAREAEKKIRQQTLAAQKQRATVRVRVGNLPTFSRIIFEMNEYVAISTDRKSEVFNVVFDAPLRFDLADAIADRPSTVEGIQAETSAELAIVKLTLADKVDVRTFREDNNFIIDVRNVEGQETQGADPALPPDVAGTAPPTANGEPIKPPIRPASDPIEKPAEPSVEPRSEAPPPATTTSPEKTVAQSEPPPLEIAGKSRPVGDAPSVVEPEKTPPSAEAAPPSASPALNVSIHHDAGQIRVAFPFSEPVAAAAFQRFDTLWLVFDTSVAIDVSALLSDRTRTIRNAVVTKTDKGQAVRIQLSRPRAASVFVDETGWKLSLGETLIDAPKPLGVARSVRAPGGTRAEIPLDDPSKLHTIADPEVGDRLFVVTAHGPPRGFPKNFEFVEFRALASAHGVVAQSLSDDLKFDLSPERVLISRVGGLTLTPPATMMADGDKQRHIASVREALFDPQGWGAHRHANFVERKHELIRAAGEAPETRRTDARLELARLYLTREMYPEAKGVLDVALIDERPKPEEVGTLVLRALANILMGRADEGLRDLGNPMIGDQHEASLWRAFGFAQQGRWNEAHQGFKANQAIVPQLPVELQRLALTNGLRAAIEVKDFTEASERVNEFQIIGIPDELQPTIDVLLGRMAEGLGRVGDALTSYRAARGSANRIAAAQGELRELVVRHSFGDIKRNEVIASLETLTTLWRGDETEIEALRILASMYTAESRYRNAFQVMRTALLAHPNAGLTRRIQEEAAGTFEELYLGDRGDLLTPIEALAMFYEYKMLTPIGRRGDEMIRRLADRLVSVDLLNQAAELLQHQVDHRLQGAARAQVGARLAMIYLFNRKPELALKTLRGTRAGDLATDVRNQRLLIEARALSDTGRHDLAVELINTRDGADAERLRADIFWSAGRHREAAEQIERMHGMRWKEFTPLTASERADLLRAAIGYSLASDGLGLDRFRQKYAAKMAETPDRRAFEIVTAPLNTGSAEFRDVVKSVTAMDTLEAFLAELRSRYPTPPAETPAKSQSDAPNPTERTATRN